MKKLSVKEVEGKQLAIAVCAKIDDLYENIYPSSSLEAMEREITPIIETFLAHSLAQAREEERGRIRAAYSYGWEDHMKDPKTPEPDNRLSDLLASAKGDK